MKSICLIVLCCLSSLCWSEVAVVVHPDNASSLTKDEVQAIFLGKKSSFPDGSDAKPFYLKPGNAARDVFDKEALGKSSSQLKSYWSKLVFTGKGTPPEELDSAASVKSKVASDKSAIAYIDKSEVDGSVKVILTF